MLDTRRNTIQTTLRRATAHIHTVSDTAELDAGLLLAHVLGKPRSYLFGHPDDALTPEQLTQFQALIERRYAGEPIAYLIGHKEFWSLDLRVTPDVLVPRPETETLVEAALACLPEDRAATVADLGTGSGAVALAIAAERPECRVIATDTSERALAVAADNAERHELTNVEFRRGDWLTALDDERVDLIAVNPPYVDDENPHLVDLQHEPQSALVADHGGLGCLRAIAEDTPRHLSPGGWLFMEHGDTQDYYVRRLLERLGFIHVSTEADLAGRPRVTGGSRPRRPA